MMWILWVKRTTEWEWVGQFAPGVTFDNVLGFYIGKCKDTHITLLTSYDH